MTDQNRALRLHAYEDPSGLRIDDVPMPSPEGSEVRVRVKAAGFNALDHKIQAGWMRGGFPLTLPAVLGLELAGVVTAVGPTTSGRLRVGDRVFGTRGGIGAYAEHVVLDEATLALTPSALGDVEAAALPVAVMTAWQVLRAAFEPVPGARILIHGASGAVGGFAVQLAKAAGAIVFATASAENIAYVVGLGADVVIDRRAERLEDRAQGIDLVVDTAGSDMVDRSWPTLAQNGVVVSIASWDVATRTPPGRRGLFFRMQADRERMHALATDVAEGRLRSTIAEVVPFAELPAVIGGASSRRSPGKVVVDMTR